MKTKRNPRQLRRMNWMKQLRKRERSASYVPTMMEPLEPRVLLSVNLPVMPGVTNNFTGVIAALSENYNRTSSTSPEYLAPSEIGGGLISVPTQMPGSFPSVRIVDGKIVGINLPQPGDLTNANDIRSGTPNDLISGAFQGLPIWGARSGAVGELTRNQTMSQQIAEDTTSLYAWGFTPSAVFGTDDGLAPGSTAGDGFGDYTNFIFGGNPGDLAFMTVTYFGALNDPSGLAGLFTPYLNLYEGGAAFDISTNGGALLNENDFDHNNGPAGSAGTSTLGSAVDGDLLLSVEVLGTSTANLTFTLVDVGRPGNAGLPDGIITPGIDQVKVTINFNAGLAVATGGKLVDEGLVELGSRVTFGFNIQQMLFISNVDGTDPNPQQFDYALLTGVTSASGDMSFFIDEPVILSSLGDYVWHDRNANGIQEDGEEGIEDVIVKLIDGTDGTTVLDTTMTDANGFYEFTNLQPGDYAVMFVKPDNFDMFTLQNQGADDAVDSDADMVTGMTQVVTLAPGEHNPTLDAGLFNKARLGDYVWHDRNANGIQEDGEEGIEGVTVKLIDGNDGTTVLDTMLTDSNGFYLFDNLMPGKYAVMFVLPDGYSMFTLQNQGSDDAVDSDADMTTGMTHTVMLMSGDEDLTIDAGVFNKAKLGDYVWFDADKDGVQDDNEVGVEGVTVKLIDGNDGTTVLDTMLTDSNGFYLFDNLMPGKYAVMFVLPSGYDSFTIKDAGSDDAKDSDADLVTGMTAVTMLMSGDMDLTLDAGLIKSNPAIDIEKYVKRVEQPGGGEGLTPGFWKTHSIYGPAPHKGWPETGYSPDDSYETIFNVNVSGTPSLLDALNTNGGGVNALLRHSTAALLNAAHPNVEYAYTVAQVLSMTKAAIDSGNAALIESTKNLFEQENELGADLSNSGGGGGGGGGGIGDDADTPTGPIVNTGDQVMFTYIVTNPGDVALSNVVVVDDNATPGDTSDDFNPTPTLAGGFNIGDLDMDNMLDVGEEWVYTAMIIAGDPGQYKNIAVVTGDAPNGSTVTDDDPAHYLVLGTETEPNPSIDIEKYVKPLVTNDCVVGNEGLTPGYWKQSHHFDDWKNYSPYQNFNSVFGVKDKWSLTLLGALGRGGGGKAALARHAVAALLNASHPNINYAYTKDQIIAMVKQAYATGNYDSVKNLLEAENQKGANLKDSGDNCNTCDPSYTPGLGDDADTAGSGPNVLVGDKVVFTYIVTNTGDVALSNVVVKDDNATPGNTSDDFLPQAVLSGGFNVGDLNKDNLLDVGEEWEYTAIVTATSAGEFKNIAVVTGTAPDSQVVTDEDPAHYKVTGVTAPKGSISGYVYKECDNDGKKESGEQGIKNVKITLTGTDKNGNAVNLVTYTDSNGYYKFDNLVEGTYKVTETQPSGYLDGKDSAGSAGGTVGNDVISNIKLGAGVHATNYNFAEIGESKLSGYVYAEKDNDGKKESGESGIANVKITLTGKNDLGQTITLVTYTNSNGYYEFAGLRPGVYSIAQTQPSGYTDGKESLGSAGGCVSNDKFYNICLDACECGVNYNFAEVPKTSSYWWC